MAFSADLYYDREGKNAALLGVRLDDELQVGDILQARGESSALKVTGRVFERQMGDIMHRTRHYIVEDID